MNAFPDYELTAEEGAKLRHVVENASLVSGGNQQIINIIQEEASAFWGGAQSAADAAQIVQSRASIYVSENLNG